MSGEVRAWIFPSTGAFSSWTANIWRTFPSLFIHHQSMSIAHVRVKLGARKIKNKNLLLPLLCSTSFPSYLQNVQFACSRLIQLGQNDSRDISSHQLRLCSFSKLFNELFPIAALVCQMKENLAVRHLLTTL